MLLFGGVAFLYTAPIFHNFDYWGVSDWDQHLFYHEVPRITMLEYGQLPLWNPYYVGGTVMLANPQSRVLSPSYALILLFGVVRGLKLDAWLHLVIGLTGTFLLGRYYGLRVSAAVLAAFVFMLNSMYALFITAGMTTFFSIAYLPWIVLAYLKALVDVRYTLAVGVGLTLLIFSGGFYPLAILLLFLALYTFVVFLVRDYRIWWLVAVYGSSLLWMVGLSAIKLLPTLAFQRANPRVILDFSGYSLNGLRLSLLSRDQTFTGFEANFPQHLGDWLNGSSYHIDENGMYVGLVPLILLVVGLVAALWTRRRMWLVLLPCMLVFGWISLGNRPPVGEVWSWLHLLPVYDSMRVAQRFRFVWLLGLALFAGLGFQMVGVYLRRRLGERWATFLMAALLAGILTDLTVVAWQPLGDAFPLAPATVEANESFVQISALPAPRPDWHSYPSTYETASVLYPALLANIGSVQGYEPAQVPRHATPADSDAYRGEVYLQDGNGTARFTHWTPNRWTVAVEVAAPDMLVVNQNYYPDWHASDRAVQSLDGLLAVPVAPGDTTITLYYWPLSFVIGTVVSAVTGVVAMGLLGFYSLRRR